MTASEKTSGVACPECGGIGQFVSDSRPTESIISGLQCIRRRRKCTGCAKAFTTHEVPVLEVERATETAFTALRQSQLEKAMVVVAALIRLQAEEKEPEAFDAIIAMISGLQRKRHVSRE